MDIYAGKKVVITGGTHGIGRTTAEALLKGGAEVVFTGRDEQTVAAASEELGERAHGLRSDATKLADVDALAAFAQERLGSVDFLFLNAGYAAGAPFAQMSEEVYDRTFAVNAKGVFFTTQRLLPLIPDGGSIVVTTSIANESGVPGMGAYAGSKAAARAFVKVLAAELLPRKIRVNAVSPGFIETPSMGMPDAPAELRAALSRMGDQLTPMRRHGTADEVANAALFLAFYATFTTGAEIVVDGGRSQRLTPPQQQ
jgi:NAD(P)-dependent dehydrogenase (short-subunit alcohol dehydrogenase family)